MQPSIGLHALVSIGFAAIVAACAATSDAGTGVETTSADALKDTPVIRVARARCRRAAECNNIGVGGTGEKYEDKSDCMDQEKKAAIEVVSGCVTGVDNGRLDKCIAALEHQDCVGRMGPAKAMPDCNSYCARAQ